MKKKNILLMGPIGDYGGRELEVGFITKALSEEYTVKICSTGYFTSKSQVFDFVNNEQMFSLAKVVVDKYFFVKLISLVAYIRFGLKYSISYFFKNKINKKYLSVNCKINYEIGELVAKNDLVIICAQLTSNYLETIISTAYSNNIPVLFRTTGTIDVVCDKVLGNKFKWLKKVNTFIHHSNTNAIKLSSVENYNYVVIDQCAYNEKKIITTPIKDSKISNFFVLSRLSKEKQVDVVINAFKNLKQSTSYLHVYGTGSELSYLKQLAKNNSNIKFYGHIPHAQIYELFYKYDCLIISSSEEAGPLTGVEAMAGGIPLISTKVGAMPERLLNYDFWYDGSQEELEIMIQKIKMLHNTQVSEFSKTLRQNYLEEYSIEAIKNKYLNIVNESLILL